MCAPSAPAAPDVRGAAEETARSTQSSQYTPYGSLVYSPDAGSPSGFKTTTTLDPNITQATNALLPQVAQQYSQPMELGSVQDIADKSYGAQTARLDPQWQQREEMERTRLANQGIGLGSEAYSNAMRDFGQQRNDAYQQANLASIATMPQTYDLAALTYAQPLNTLNALRTGAPMTSGITPTNYLGAAQQEGQWNQGLYNADMGAYNAQLGGASALGAALLFSDRRLKRNIYRIGTHPLGIGVYEYDIFDRHEIGVMADEVERVMPQAVITGSDGYKRVNYALL